MIEPMIAATFPAAVELKAGQTIYWCSCGLSANQPYCDGSHTGDFNPLPFTAEADGTYYLCQCKQTATPPLCDGAHNRFAEAGQGWG